MKQTQNRARRLQMEETVWVVINCKILLTRGTETQTLLLVGYKHTTFV